jgi:3-oxoacyl-ACP reductase-like protein
MSIFGSIVSAIFGSKPAATASQSAGSSGTTTQSAALEAAARSAGAPAATTAPPAGAPASAAQPMSRAEVEAMIKKIADAQSEDLNWRQSIVDLMKLLKLDSSLNARKQLAKELGYTGTPDGSAEMNIWLHKQVMTKLAESGGKVPEGLRA